MSVSDGNIANQGTFNSSFLSREIDTDTIGKMGLLNVGSPTIADVQLELNKSIIVSSTVQTINAGGIITINSINKIQKVRVKSSGGTLILANAPFGGAGTWLDSTRIRIWGDDATNKCKILTQNIANGILFRDASVTLGLYDMVEVEWDNIALRFLEVGRNF